LWRKGATSGNTQELVSARWDCDRDAILFNVIQTGPTCHKGNRSCFTGDAAIERAVLEHLDQTIAQRRCDPSAKSYTRRLLDDRTLLDAKLREEIEEVIEAKTVDEIAWEAADVIYHLLVHAHGRGVDLDRIRNELRSRMH
jgi:phosphoribosyl-ATP pyrophosphohydrolase